MTSNCFSPSGAAKEMTSPSFWPISARAIGEV
jgi:hypothetical protein